MKIENNKVAVCVIGRLENRYAKEFVDHYLSIGVNKIFIYDNNHDGEEYFEDVLQEYIDNELVEVISYRNFENVQNTAYNDCYKKHGNEYEWFIFCDFDEFLVLNNCNKVQAFLHSKKDFDCVLLNWKCMTDNNLIHDDGRPMLERFIVPCDKDVKVQYDFSDNKHIKSIVRGGLDYLMFYGQPHVPVNPLKCCNAIGQPVMQSPFQNIEWSVAYFKHFVTKTIEEYVENKMKRGVGDRDHELFLATYKGRFFKYNEETEEKLKWLRDHNIDWI